MLNPMLCKPGHLPYRSFATGKKTYRPILDSGKSFEALPQYFKTATKAEQFAAKRIERLKLVYDRRVQNMIASPHASD